MNVSKEQLKIYIARIECLDEEKKGLAEDIKNVYSEAKAFGFDPKIMRKVIALRKQDANERAEQEAILDIYLSALGMTPIEQAIAEGAQAYDGGYVLP
jgi:uncharacterized protein (UPF0335 family)